MTEERESWKEEERTRPEKKEASVAGEGNRLLCFSFDKLFGQYGQGGQTTTLGLDSTNRHIWHSRSRLISI
jgi:hypothetical protein